MPPVTLDQVGLAPGPLAELDQAMEPPKIDATLQTDTAQLWSGFTSNLAFLSPALLTLQNQIVTEESRLAGIETPLIGAAAAIDAGTIAAEAQLAASARAQAATVDAEIATLASLDPATPGLPPVSFTTPELDLDVVALLRALFSWDTAFPLWPFQTPG